MGSEMCIRDSFPDLNLHHKRKHSDIKTPSPKENNFVHSRNFQVNTQLTPDTIHNNTLSPLTAPFKKLRSLFRMSGNRTNKSSSIPTNYRQNPDTFSDSSSQHSSGGSDNFSLLSSSTASFNTSHHSRSRSRPRRFHEPDEKKDRPATQLSGQSGA